MTTATEPEPKLRGDSAVDPRDDKRGPKVRAMFAGIARKYDLLNRIISGGRDQAWRKRTVKMAQLKGGERVLDVCCGTGDLALMFQRLKPKPSEVVASDFTPEMLVIAQQKAGKAGVKLPLAAADALHLPFNDAEFDVVSVGYGVRNFQDIDAGLRELARVLKPGGRLAILEATPARGLIGRFANWYINRVVPWLGNVLTGSGDKAYSYLADSIQLFPDARALKQRLESAGFTEVRFRKLNLGTMAIHVGVRE
ncbi:MAG: bifunctional demethylmenaquinone methyltransferase/2-methoxy-6-polyprenyl-1,4-benzoquinol methylase UbiE [Planctomycetes bacterium]|nr:bifunctional demethylmenaquinone methyltransferase/2-methoxy-6-polyprenyl-1,4-benzoquinol methylase UbiE [Planctomycetota bacterium]MCA8935908.1 bifunctional demethylmenaquinone methyltransferase/2-methoxy-6-polyprenyl-1,4-benzoquinol methylase UbiE [Planctomycetota bacterium]